MDTRTIEVIKECKQRALDGTLRFPDILQQLAQVGVSHYHVDFLRAEETCYLGTGESHVERLPMPAEEIAGVFSAPGVAAAVKASQQEALPYPEFLVRAHRAGCIGYVVYLDGRRVVYTGRTGEAHVEHFPPAV